MRSLLKTAPQIERHIVLWQLITASPSPSPAVDDTLVTPGVWGFVVTAVIMVAAILLIIDMVRRMRRVNYRAEIRQRLEDEAKASTTPPQS